MSPHVHTPELTVPEALMAFLHADNGRPYETAKPGALTAAAEVAELIAGGHARVTGPDGDQLVVDGPAASDRAWIRELTTQLAGRATDIATWVKRRDGALDTQQAEAAARGVLVQDRKRLAGLIPYSTNTVDPAVRQALLEHLTGPGAEADPRAAVLARLLVKSRLHLRGGLGRAERTALEQLSERAPASTPAPAAMSAVDIAMVTVVYTTVISE
ncbi:GPP34 family phosphoprotein [Modestobacter italicus]|uniref:GPP34 family phosphoprotein n=1 Tax=Modestobacter italicus (strain DSM 44449 / CECT 9708 / BC 501) TaxID=2732864 RepID=UPI001C976A29|nr:GPP34 family phosphoprotein [Modestobacter italicus]